MTKTILMMMMLVATLAHAQAPEWVLVPGGGTLEVAPNKLTNETDGLPGDQRLLCRASDDHTKVWSTRINCDRWTVEGIIAAGRMEQILIVACGKPKTVPKKK